MFWFAVYVSLHYELISHRSHSDVQAVGTDVPMKGDKFVSVGIASDIYLFHIDIYLFHISHLRIQACVRDLQHSAVVRGCDGGGRDDEEV